MASFTVTIADEEGRAATVQVGAQEPLDTLKALVQTELNVPVAQQVFLKDGRPISPGATVAASGITDNDFLYLMRDTQRPAGPSMASGGASSAGHYRSLADLPPNLDPPQLVKVLNENPRLLKELEFGNPDLAGAIKSQDVVKVRGVIMKQKLQSAKVKHEQEKTIRELEADPMNPENQKKIEEMLRLENVHKNWEIAMEEMPEAFGRVVMLYIDTEVNGVHIKAFVDSGAQSTIMSRACADRCGLMRLLDTRFAGVAQGVGTAKILGRVHIAQLKVGSSFFPCTFTVLDQNDVDLLFGLDMLKRHQCVIDLKRGVLALGSAGVEVPFLGEHDLPMRARGNFDGDMEVDTHKDAAEGGSKPSENAAAGASGGGASSAVEGIGGGASPSPMQTSSSTPSAAAIEELTKLGFSREQAAVALSQANGDVSLAASLLFAQGLDP